MRNRHQLVRSLLTLALFAFPVTGALAQNLPSDVKNGHWAETSVQQIVSQKVLDPQSGKFNGDAKVTRSQAVIALAKLARLLEKGEWKPRQSRALTSKVIPTLAQGDWKTKPVTRYVLAASLARFGNYFANGVPRPAAGSNTGKSEIPGKATVTLAATDPAYDALTYLAKNRMIGPTSPLLKPDSKPITGAEMSRALAQMASGLTDILTDLGQDETGTIDATSKKKKKS